MSYSRTTEQVTRLLLEIAADGLGSALAAQAGGADRVELCADLAEGGVTPSFGVISAARAALALPVHVLIRPRAGDFRYSQAELRVMQYDIEECARLGCHGVVIGALDAAGDVDLAACRDLIAAAGSMSITFHRAFDVVRDRQAALEALVGLGCKRVLTSGAHSSAPEGAAAIAAVVRQAAGRIGVMAGAGIRPQDVRRLVAATGVREIHASASARRTSPAARQNALRGLDADWRQTDPEAVRRLVDELRAAEAAP
jgi:copper homeostasis protein